MDGEQYASKVRNKALDDFDCLRQRLERKFRADKMLRLANASPSLFSPIFIMCMSLLRFTK